MTSQPRGPSNLTFLDIHQLEREEIKKRRAKQSYDPDDLTSPNFVGLALSGGGIRSATFCLGFLQELHRLKLLRIFDYLSTVSGGGYLGGWWSACHPSSRARGLFSSSASLVSAFSADFIRFRMYLFS